jgi:hypothetical protein
METEEQPHHHFGGIYNYFEGATIHNFVINNNLPKEASDHHENSDKEKDKEKDKENLTAEQVSTALKECSHYVWGNAAYSVAFCVCRDLYGMENASFFERMLTEKGIELPSGTINNAMSRNSWMRYSADKWEEHNVLERVLKLRDAFKTELEKIMISEKKTA